MLQCSHEKREGKKAQGRQEMKRGRERKDHYEKATNALA